MSTLPSQASKGEKPKPKFQSLDINSLYRNSRGENLEKTQQKSSSTFVKHGMQSLGKVPNARRAPANLPSLKSEHSGTDAAVPLVPPGASGWGKQDSTSSTSSTNSPSTSTSTTSNTPCQPTTQLTSHQAAIALPVTTTIPPPQQQQLPQQQQQQQQQKHPAPVPTATTDKLWSSVMSGQDPLHPPLYQSPQFQHEFPSLSAGDGVPMRTGSDAQYPSGLSLRPQTEGSWTQGGTKPGMDGIPRPGSAPLGAPPQLSAQVGQQPQVLPHQFRGVLPPFMFKGNNFAQGGVGIQTQNAPLAANGRNRPIDNRPPRLTESEEIAPRPIIKEEDLQRMDEIGTDMGWAGQDDIDYNQKLAFSDDESDKKPRREHKAQLQRGEDAHLVNNEMQAQRNYGRSSNSRSRSSEEDDAWVQKCRRHTEELGNVVQKAMQRKEEEEKRFNEATKQGAQKKLLLLEEKINKRKNSDHKDSPRTINPASIPPKPINHAEIPIIPDFQKDKERDRESRSRTPNDGSDDKPGITRGNSFKLLTQIEGKSFPRKYPKVDRGENRDREMRDQNCPNFSRNFQNDMPPRFMRHQRNNSNSNLQQHYHQFDNRWQNNQNAKPVRHESPEREVDDERKDYKRQSSEDSFRGSHHSQSDASIKEHRAVDEYNGREKEEDKWHREKEPAQQDDWHEHREKEKPAAVQQYERPQRPDSRDSRSTRHSRDSEPREYIGSWPESFETNYDDKQRREPREGGRVPGPITKDRIEADDMKNEKRSLTQLKRGQMAEKKLIDSKGEADEKSEVHVSAWADSIPTAIDLDKSKAPNLDMGKSHFVNDPKKLDKSRPYQSRANANNEYHRSAWPKRPINRGVKLSGPNRSSISGEFHGTDSEGSLDEHGELQKKMGKKFEKDDKNRDNKQEKNKSDRRDGYVPRGEPSRHGRGAANFRTRMGLSKRIEGYGPPPSKSPFGHSEDKERKVSGDETDLYTDDKAKQNQQALAAGIAMNKKDVLFDDKNKRRIDNRRVKPRSGKKDDDICDTNSENSDEKDGKLMKKSQQSKPPMRTTSATSMVRRNPPPRLVNDKRNYEPLVQRQNTLASGVKKDDKLGFRGAMEPNELADAFLDIALDNLEESEASEEKEEKSPFNEDSEGFQEVKSKKAVKKPPDDKPIVKGFVKEKDPKLERKKLGTTPSTTALTQQQIQNIPSLMATPINPPPIMVQSKHQFERPRPTKLAPRFVKQKLQKAQMQQHGICDVSDIGKVNQNINVYGMKDASAAVSACAWDKPLPRNIEHDAILGVGGMDAVKSLEQNTSVSPNPDKILNKPNQLQDKLDGATPPVNTIIFENTNFKSAPGARNNQRNEKPRSKLDETGIDASVINTFNKPISELLNKNSDKSEGLQLPLSFKEDNADMKLDFFGSDLSHLTDEKSTKNLCISKMSTGSTMCTTDSLNFKIASVKKVWENEPNVGPDDGSTSFANFATDPNSLDPNNVFSKDGTDDSHEGFSPSANQTASTTTNVCKVKPTQQVSGGGVQTILNPTSHPQHSGIVAPGLMGNPLSPPPMQQGIGANVGIGQPAQYTANQHIGYQFKGNNQYGIPAIPSPPTVPTMLYNSTQQLQAQTGLYGPFQIDQSGVLGGQGRSQYSQYPSHYGLSQTGSSPYSAQSVYLQQTPSHPPPTAQAPPELYTNINNYRLSATAPFGQNQQLNNPTTVLISSTSNSLMSASVKPSSQQISAIGTKAGGVGQAYQPQSQQGQVYLSYDPAYLSNAGVMQRGPAGPVQNNVVPALQSSSYYSGSTGGQTGYFQQPGSSTLQSASLQQHQAGYGLQGNVFGTHNQSHNNAGMQSYNSHFLSAPIQVAAALGAQQYRSGLQTQYMKGVGNQQLGDQNRPQQLKSPSNQEVLSSVFNTGPQIPSPKSKQNCKHPPPQSSPTAQHKYNLYSVNSHQSGNIQSYPAPIQRPSNFQPNLGVQNNSANNQNKHRSNANNKVPNRNYYSSSQNNAMPSQNDKVDDAKLNSSVSMGGNANTANNSSNKNAIGSVAPSSEIVKDNNKEESSNLKD